MTKPTGLQNALIALSFFRRRHRKAKKGGRDITHYRDSVHITCHYISEARAHGWRGSIKEAVTAS